MHENDSFMEPASLAEEIVKIVHDTFLQRRQVVLLSYVGQSLTRRGIDFRHILGDEKLADFIRRTLSQKVTVVSMPSDQLNLAAYPSDIDITKEIDPFGKQKRQPSTARVSLDKASEKRPLVLREVWFTFSHALAEGHERVLRLRPYAEYEDYPASADPRPEGYPIDRSLIVPAGTLPKEERDEQLYSNIETWARQAGVEISDITRERSERTQRRSALDILLNALRPSDLERVTMPLDIVNHLRNKQI